MGNPDFEKIKAADYQQYFFQLLHETLKEFPKSNRVLELWKKGFEQNIFVFEIHGREHVNVKQYVKILQSHVGKEGLRYALDHHSVGPIAFNRINYPNYLGALHPETKAEVPELHQYILDAGNLFHYSLGYHPWVFIVPNAEEPKELEFSLNLIGIKYLTRSKKKYIRWVMALLIRSRILQVKRMNSIKSFSIEMHFLSPLLRVNIIILAIGWIAF